MNGRAAQLTQDIQRVARDIRQLRETLWGLHERYTAEGGQEFLHEHFIDADGEPREDLDITEAKIVTGVYACGEVLKTLTTYRDSLLPIAT